MKVLHSLSCPCACTSTYPGFAFCSSEAMELPTRRMQDANTIAKVRGYVLHNACIGAAAPRMHSGARNLACMQPPACWTSL